MIKISTPKLKLMLQQGGIHLKMLLLIVTLLHSNSSYAEVPPCPYPRTFEQPDGSSFEGMIKGNMYLYYVETMDGYTVIKDEADGFYKYAVSGPDGELFLTNTPVSEVESRTAPEKLLVSKIAKHVRYEGASLKKYRQKPVGDAGPQFVFPSNGIRKALMILVDFPDQLNTYSVASVDNLLNQPGYNVNGQSGSFRDYYLAASYGMLTINSDVVGWYTATSNKATYGNANGSAATRPLIRMAVDSAEAHGVNFAQYDGDNDGAVDVVMVIHSGRGAEESANGADIWSHRWVLGSSLQVTYDGKLISDYIIQPEKYGTTNLTNIGVIVHEFGHALGLPDLYDTDYSSRGLGNWCVMAGGTWNNSGKTPAQMSAWCKQELGWVTPVSLTGTGTISTIKNLNDSSQVYKLATTNPQEYFLIENRQKVGWDAHIPGNGLCIYHVDETQTNNTNELQYWVNLEQADGLSHLNNNTNSGDAADPFPGTSNKTVFNCTSTPNTNLYSSASTNIAISGIAAAGAILSLNYGVCTAPPVTPVNDNCGGAIALTLNAPAITASNVGATDDTPPAVSCGTSGQGAFKGVWYSFTAPYSGSFTLSTCPDAGNDIYARIYTGSSCASLTTCVAFSDDDCGYSPQFSFTGVANTVYYILIGTYYNTTPTGTFPLRIFTPLNIELGTIEAKNIGGKQNRIMWSSLSEGKGDYYELERSTDGELFNKIATIKGKNAPSNYTFTDENGEKRMNYYRVKMINAKGEYNYSKTVAAFVSDRGGIDIVAYPNPASESVSITIYGNINHNARLKLMDVTGKTIKVLDVTSNTEVVDLNNLAKGIYLIKFEDGNYSQTLRITKE